MRTEPGVILLTPREIEVLNLRLAGLCLKEIAAKLGCGLSTVKYHVRNILAKSGAEDTLSLYRRFGHFEAKMVWVPDPNAPRIAVKS